MRTQWRTGMAGPTGLDYGVLREVMTFVGVPAELHTDTFDCVRAMESAALAEIHKKD